MWRCWWLSRWESLVRSVESARSGLRFRSSTSSQLIRPSSARLKNSPFVREDVLFYQQGSAAPPAATRLALPPAPNAGQHPVPGNLAPARRPPQTRSRLPVARHSSRSRVETRAQSAVDAGRQSPIVGVTISRFKTRNSGAPDLPSYLHRKATSSRIILIITSGLASVEVPRFRGK